MSAYSPTPRSRGVEQLFGNARKGGVSLYVTLPTLSEVLYVASKIYALAGVGDPNGEALLLALWLTARASVAQLAEGWR